MSFNRENVTWQNSNGDWFIGFYTVAWEGSEADGEDPEWDVEYDYRTFETVVGPARSADAVRAMWRGANPGGSTVYSDPADPAVEQFERMAAPVLKAAADYAAKQRYRGGSLNLGFGWPRY